MKKILLYTAFFFTAAFCYAQPGEWVWIHGPNTSTSTGTFGVQGVSDPANNPPGLYEACEFKDQSGHFWLFGGVNNNVTFGDLWKYDLALNEWTWMKGSGLTNTLPNYGIMGVPSATNDPGSRGFCTVSWVDNQGNFWIFGGLNGGGGIYADLWRYEPTTNNWTWMKGPQGTGSLVMFGTQGVSDPANFPGCRYESAAAWTDNSDCLWLFGGFDNAGGRNDLWRYNISSNEWTWMKGSQLTGDSCVYGLQGVEDPGNTPSGRAVYSHWKDLNGNFWLFAGTDFVATNHNDLWRYNPVTNNWAWFKGSSSNGVYGAKCISDTANTPSIRFENRAAVRDANGNFWLFGGCLGANTVYNDLWKYCLSSNQWTWISGDPIYNPVGNWGTLGVSSPLNVPNARMGALMWSDQSGHLYLFGGTNNSWPGTYSDLWKFTIDTACAPCISQPTAVFNATNQICSGTCIDFINTSLSSTSFQWNFPGGNPSSSTNANPSNICYTTPGSFDVTLIASNGAASDTLTISNYITVFPTPPPQGILQSGDTLFAIQGAASYQWYFNGNIIPGATDYYYLAAMSGDYNVVAADANGCEVEAVINDVIAGLIPALSKGEGVTVFPNPVSDKLEIKNLNAGTNITIIIYNNVGEKVYESKEEKIQSELTIDVKALTAGIYFLELSDGKISTRKIFTKR